MDNLTSDIKNQSNKNKSNWLLLVVLLLVAGAGIFLLYRQRQGSEPLAHIPSSENTVKEELVNLSAEDRAILEQKVVTYKEEVNNLKADVSAEDKLSAYMRLASLQNQLGQYSDALATLNKIAQDYQDSAKLWSLYSNIYDGMRDQNRSIEAIKKAISLEESNPRYWFLYFKIVTDISTEEREALYQEALTKTENNINIVKSYAEYLESIDNKEAAIATWEQAKQVDPDFANEYQSEIDRLRQ
ncbi:MAG: tetratricopeptide repeat protein [Candidatus Doudnabacteria bacterium]